MCEEYRGYRINTFWNEKELGFEFRIYDAGGTEIGRDELPFFYEENALAAARKAVDEKLKVQE